MSTLTTSRNQSMELAKLIASFFVVCIHYRLPNPLGAWIEALSRFAVPMFFLISGYFNLGAGSCQVSRRLKNIGRLYLIAIAVTLLWGCISTELDGGSTVSYLIKAIPDPDEWYMWLAVQSDPFAAHLWYLNAICVVYGLYWLYLRFFEGREVDRKPLYFMGFVLFAIYFYACAMPTTVPDETVLKACRNAWFTGIPMFAIGMFLREYEARILQSFRLNTGKMVLLILGGIALVTLQWSANRMTFLPIGTLPVLAGVMLLTATHPHISGNSRFWATVFARCGTWSTWIYILHPLVRTIYKKLLRPGVFALITEEAERAIHPLIVIALSLLTAMVIERAGAYLKKKSR